MSDSLTTPFSSRAAVTRVFLVLILSFGVLLYWPGLSGGFVFDDFGNLIFNTAMNPETVRSHFWVAVWSSSSGPTDRPLSMLTFVIQDWFTGLAPWPLKFVNVVIHITNGLLIFLLSRLVLTFASEEHFNYRALNRCHADTNHGWLITPNALALLITAAWVFSPVQLTAVLYVIQRMESLSAMFVLAGLLLYWHGRMRLIRGHSKGWVFVIAGLLGGTILATLAKETGVMLPLYAFLLEWLILRGRSASGFEPKFVVLYALLLFAPGFIGVLYTLPAALNGAAYVNRPFDLDQRLWTEGRVILDYLRWIIAPTPNALTLFHDDVTLSTGWLTPWSTAWSWALIAGLIGSALWLRQRMPLFTLGVLWFFAGHTLVSTYLPLELVYEHRNYLPSWGVFIALSGLMLAWSPTGVERRSIWRTLLIVISIGTIILYAGITAIRAQTWGNPYRLAYFQATTHPDSARASYDLGRIMMTIAPNNKSSMLQMGMTQMEQTARFPGANLQAELALIFISAKSGLAIKSSWWDSIHHKLAVQPISAEDVNGLYSLITCDLNGVCHYSAEDVAALGNTLKLAVDKNPDNSRLITLLANFEANLAHNYPTAYELMQRAVALGPEEFDYWSNLVTMQIAANQFSEARVGIERMQEINTKGIHDATIVVIQNTLREKEASTTSQTGAEK